MAKAAKKSGRARLLKRRVAFRGPVFTVTSDMVEEPSGIRARRDVLWHPGSVVILAVDDAGGEPRVLLARQFRYAAGRDLWELPAGRKDKGEATLAAAKRELLEETGYRARRWQRVLFFYASPGFLDETMAVYLARGLQAGAAQPEEDEKIVIRFFALSRALRMVMSGALRDGKTIAAVLWLQEKLGRRRARH